VPTSGWLALHAASGIVVGRSTRSLAVMKVSAKFIALAAILGVAVHLAFQLPLGWSLLAFLVGWPIAGTLITADDYFPGGWSNPDGKTPFIWSYAEFWGEITLRLGFSFVGFAIDSGWNTQESVPYWTSAIIGAISGLAIIKRWPYQKHDG
jgi:hypothetical protein